MNLEEDIAALRRRIAAHRALLRHLSSLRWDLVNRAGPAAASVARSSLRLNEETTTALWRAVHAAETRLADLVRTSESGPPAEPGTTFGGRSGDN